MTVSCVALVCASSLWLCLLSGLMGLRSVSLSKSCRLILLFLVSFFCHLIRFQYFFSLFSVIFLGFKRYGHGVMEMSYGDEVNEIKVN